MTMAVTPRGKRSEPSSRMRAAQERGPTPASTNRRAPEASTTAALPLDPLLRNHTRMTPLFAGAEHRNRDRHRGAPHGAGRTMVRRDGSKQLPPLRPPPRRGVALLRAVRNPD